MKSFYLEAINKKKENFLYRKPINSDIIDDFTIRRGKKKLISFACNDYFSLSQNNKIKKSAIDAVEKYGLGARASRYITGNNSLYNKLEKQIAKMKNCEDAIVFSSGYSLAIGVIPALVSDEDLIVMDRLMHSSAIDGAKLSGAKLIRFLHNDVNHAKKILQENRSKFKKCIIITETVFSMDGDLGKVKELLELAQKFDSILISDDAHGLFLNCNDKIVAMDKIKSIHLQMGTFSKAVGSLGGYICGDKEIIDYLHNFAKSAIYSTALPPAILAASLQSLKIIEKENFAEKTLENAKYFCNLMNLPEPQSAIVVIVIGDDKKVIKIAKKVAENGFLISAIRPPTVEVGKSRLRITFSRLHKENQIKKLANILIKLI